MLVSNFYSEHTIRLQKGKCALRRKNKDPGGRWGCGSDAAAMNKAARPPQGVRPRTVGKGDELWGSAVVYNYWQTNTTPILDEVAGETAGQPWGSSHGRLCKNQPQENCGNAVLSTARRSRGEVLLFLLMLQLCYIICHNVDEYYVIHHS